MIPLKQSTQKTIRIGPFLDKTDGVTEEAALVGNGTELSKDGAAFAVGPTLSTVDAEGFYPITLSTVNVDTLGPMRLKSHDNTVHLPVWEDFVVYPANVYDSLFSTDRLQVDVREKGDSNLPLTTQEKADVEKEADDALIANHLDHLLKTNYDPASKPGVATALLNELIEDDGGVSRYTANALEQAPAAVTAAAIADAVWDELTTGHNTVGSYGSMFKPERENLAQSGTNNTIVLDSGAPNVENFFNGSIIKLISGTGADQSRRIQSYEGSSNTVTVDQQWGTNPDATTRFVIISSGSAALISRNGNAQAGTNNTIRLDSTASNVDDFYNGDIVYLVSGTGIGQARKITDYVGSNNIATVSEDWGTNPDATTKFLILPNGIDVSSVASAVADAVWDELRSGHLVAGSFGESAQIIRNGTAQAGAAGSITLDAGASAIDDFYNRQLLCIVAGTGVGQCRTISDYDGTTLIATVQNNWATNPDATSQFVILPFGDVSATSDLTSILGVSLTENNAGDAAGAFSQQFGFNITESKLWENRIIDNITYQTNTDGSKSPTSFDVEVYPSKADVAAKTNLIRRFKIVNTYNADDTLAAQTVNFE